MKQTILLKSSKKFDNWAGHSTESIRKPQFLRLLSLFFHLIHHHNVFVLQSDLQPTFNTFVEFGFHGLCCRDEGNDLFGGGVVGRMYGGAAVQADFSDVGVLSEQFLCNRFDGNLFRLVVGERGRQFGDAVVQGLDLLVGMLKEAFHHLGLGDLLTHAGGVFVEDDLVACNAIFLGALVDLLFRFVGQGLASEEQFQF